MISLLALVLMRVMHHPIVADPGILGFQELLIFLSSVTFTTRHHGHVVLLAGVATKYTRATDCSLLFTALGPRPIRLVWRLRQPVDILLEFKLVHSSQHLPGR